MKTCTACKQTLPEGKFPAKGTRCNTCVNKAAWQARKAKSKPMPVRAVRHPWEALGADSRPNWSRV